MSWLSSLGHKIGSIADNKWVKGATAAALAATGVGAPLGAAILGGEGLIGGALKPGGNLGTALQGGATGAVEGYGASKLGGAVRKLGSAASILGGGGSDDPQLPDLPVIDGDGNVVSNGGAETFGGFFPPGDQPVNGGGGWEDTLKGVLGSGVRKLGSGVVNAVTGGGGLNAGDLATGGLAAYQAYNAAKASQRAGQLSDKAINLAESRWNDASPLRAAGQARLLNPVKPQLNDVFADPSNPFAVRKLRSV